MEENLTKQTVDKINNDDKSLEEIIRDIANEEGMTYEETMKLFQRGLREGLRVSNKKLTKADLAKKKAKRKMANKSKKTNRKK